MNPGAPLPSGEVVLACLEENPYYSALAFEWLKRVSAEQIEVDQELKRRLAVFAVLGSPGDGNSLQYRVLDLIGGYESMDDFYPSGHQKATPTTFEAIDTFLDSYGGSHDRDKESEVIENMIFNPTVDYAAVLEAEEKESLPAKGEADKGSQEDLINTYILAHHDGKKEEKPRDFDPSSKLEEPPVVPDAKPVEIPKDQMEVTPLSESLAKIYIKTKNYEGAREIIHRLNLKYPEKSVYFAVQLRFLDKLIINQQLQARRNAH